MAMIFAQIYIIKSRFWFVAKGAARRLICSLIEWGLQSPLWKGRLECCSCYFPGLMAGHSQNPLSELKLKISFSWKLVTLLAWDTSCDKFWTDFVGSWQVTLKPTSCCQSRGWLFSRRQSSCWISWLPGQASIPTLYSSCPIPIWAAIKNTRST